MTPTTQEWAFKAEQDYQGAAALNRRRKVPLPDVVCFLCQQSAEKYLKAYLNEHAIPFPKTHDLATLLVLAAKLDESLTPLQPHLKDLFDYAVDVRYPGYNTTPPDAREALAHARAVRDAIRKRLGAKPRSTGKKKRKRKP